MKCYTWTLVVSSPSNQCETKETKRGAYKISLVALQCVVMLLLLLRLRQNSTSALLLSECVCVLR